MRIIDLSQSLHDGMAVYPGDPDVRLRRCHTIANEGWNLRELNLGSHTATHVNAPSHMIPGGATLDDLPLNAFCGRAVVCTGDADIRPGLGLIFRDMNIDPRLAGLIIRERPPFVGLSERFEMDLEIERMLLAAGIPSFENLARTDDLPVGREFLFVALPLKIAGGDGSPVRAAAILDPW